MGHRTLGAQGTVCGGGRYDGLVEQLGGKPNFAAGFSMGCERLISMLIDQQLAPARGKLRRLPADARERAASPVPSSLPK